AALYVRGEASARPIRGDHRATDESSHSVPRALRTATDRQCLPAVCTTRPRPYAGNPRQSPAQRWKRASLRELSSRRRTTARGVAVVTSTCSRGHSANEQGSAVAPPLWGARSYNVGAGMARISTEANFSHALMPIDRARQLSPQQAFDVASYINSRPRPDFPRKANDWPHGGKPPDADYHVLPPVTPKEKRQ